MKVGNKQYCSKIGENLTKCNSVEPKGSQLAKCASAGRRPYSHVKDPEVVLRSLVRRISGPLSPKEAPISQTTFLK